MRSLLILFFLPFALIASSQKVSKNFQVKHPGLTVEFESGNALNGFYSSKYLNGRTRAEGNFRNNVRTGTWTVYDSTGKKIHQRNYTQDHLSFIQLFPEPETKGPASLFDTAVYHAVKNADGIIPYFEITERMVVYATRIWRTVPAEGNEVFYKKDLLYKTLHTFIIDSANSAFCSSDEDFVNQIFPSQLKKYSLDNYSIINWKIKEDTFYDIDRKVSETRIIGICPIGIDKKNKDTADLFWVYFPYIRKPLSQVNLKIKNEQGEIQTLDDLFFFRNFSSQIYKQSNASNRELKDYCATPLEIELEKWRIETRLIEMEHEIWLGNLPK